MPTTPQTTAPTPVSTPAPASSHAPDPRPASEPVAASAPESSTVTPSELGRHLLTIRGFHFVLGSLGDPYARLLRGEGDDAAALGDEIRGKGPLYRSDLGTWVVAGGEAAAELLRDPRLDVRHPGGDREHLGENLWETWRTCHVTPMDGALLTLPLADYRRLDRVNRPVLGPVVAGAWREDVRRAADRIAGGLGEAFDLAGDLVGPAVAESLTRVLGLSPQAGVVGAAGREVADLLPRLGVALDAVLCPPRLPVAHDLEQAVARARELVRDLVAERAAEPGDDAVSAMLATGLGPADVAAVCLLHLVAGAEIAAAVAADTFVALLDHPGQWAAVCRSPELAADAVEETVRWSPPVRLVSRIAQEPIALHGQEIDADGHVVIVVDAANRDLAGLPDPDRYDLAHAGAPRLSLTGGGYEELVAPLARVVATEIVRVAATRWPGLRADGAVVRRMRSPVVRAVVRLPLCR